MSSWWKLVAPWLAPALLCSIALTQFTYAHFSSLSPWKGGCFGMFSTVDSPGARFLRIRLVTPRGEIPVFIPDELREPARRLRTLPTERLTAEFAQTVSEGTWIRLRLASAVQYYQHLLRRLGRDDQVQELAAELHHLGQPMDPAIDFNELNFVRMLSEDEAPNAADEIIDVRSVRVEIWKYSFDRTTETLNAVKFLEVTSVDSG